MFPRKRYLRDTIFWAIALLYLPLMISCSTEPGKKDKSASKKSKSKKASAEEVISVTAIPVSTREIPWVIKAQGRTEASEKFEAKAPANVKVQKVMVEQGGRVQAGDPLIQYSDDESKLRLNKARAEIKEAEAAIENDNFMEQNKDKLTEEGKMTELEADWLADKLNLHQATLERAKAEVELYEHMASLEQVNSPISGVVAEKTVSDGGQAAEDQTVVEIVRLDPIHFVFNVPTDDVPAVEKEPEIVITFPSFGSQTFTGEVTSVGAVAKAEGGGIDVIVKIPNADLALKGSMMGNIEVRGKAQKLVAQVPETAVIRSERSAYVFKADGDKAKKISVEVGDVISGLVTLTKGLQPTDLVINNPPIDLYDGSRIEYEKKQVSPSPTNPKDKR